MEPNRVLNKFSALWSVWNTVCQKKIRTCRKFLHDLYYVSIDEMQTVMCLELFAAARRHAPAPKGQWKVPLGKMILFSACCICGLIGGILNFQFLRALTKKSSALYPLHVTSMSLACIGIGGCTLSSWLTCRLASYEQRRMFSEREHSLHHSHEMGEKEMTDNMCNGGPHLIYNGRAY
ncbi:Hypothetical predicted protein [Podarcis lilfordi]|uniref:Transmembrane protein 196 n=1 Tax=Podarcis lilfordi TaxID=74358 RepID=A0AA35PHQ2_9SAUR|nr:Hypothetical predicted protein [Podarcis lilfordi]